MFVFFEEAIVQGKPCTVEGWLPRHFDLTVFKLFHPFEIASHDMFFVSYEPEV